MGMLPKAVMMAMKNRGKPKGPYKSMYEADTNEEPALTEQAAAPAPGDPIEISDDNDNHDPDDQQIFSAESDDNNDGNDPDDDNDPNDDYSQSSNGADKKKRSKRKTPTIGVIACSRDRKSVSRL